MLPFELRLALMTPDEVASDLKRTGVPQTFRTLCVLGELVPIVNRWGTFFTVNDVDAVIVRHGAYRIRAA